VLIIDVQRLDHASHGGRLQETIVDSEPTKAKLGGAGLKTSIQASGTLKKTNRGLELWLVSKLLVLGAASN
jgi:hypothetical protein